MGKDELRKGGDGGLSPSLVDKQEEIYSFQRANVLQFFLILVQGNSHLIIRFLLMLHLTNS